MRPRQRFFVLLCVCAAMAALQPRTGVTAEPKETPKTGKAAGILFDKTGDYVTVKADGEDEPVKYTISKDNKKVTEALKSIFNASRVTLTYKQNGDTRELTGIARQVRQKDGTVTGEVVKVHNNFWVEVKPKGGVADAYAPGGNFKDKEFMAKLLGLKPGDIVTIKYTTDGERHRILNLQINKTK